MANTGAKLSSFPEVNDIQTGDMFPLLSGGNTNAKIDYATLADAIIAKLKSETGDGVLSINGKTGAVTLSKADVGLGNVDNTSDADKPVSTAVQNALDGKANNSVATSSADGLMSKSDKAKLDEIEAGSNVKSVNGKTGAVTLEKGDVGLGSVDNTKDVDKPISTAMQTALDKKADKTIATASADGLMSKTDKAKLDGIGAGSNVKSVNGKTGAVTLSKADVDLGNVDNTKDADKPISTAVQTALDAKANNSVATESTDGLMSAADKTKLDSIDPSATGDNIDEATMNFTSSDVADGSATAWTSVPALASGEKHSAILGKISQMLKNVRYLWKMLGTTDISKIGDGTATGAIASLNADLAKQETAVDSNASQISSNTSAISTLNSDLANLKFGVDSDGNYGYIKPGADTVIPFKDLTWGTPFKTHLNIPSEFFVSVTISFPKPPKIIIVPMPGQVYTHYPSWFAAVDLTNQQTTYTLKSSTGWNTSGSGYSCDADVYWAY